MATTAADSAAEPLSSSSSSELAVEPRIRAPRTPRARLGNMTLAVAHHRRVVLKSNSIQPYLVNFRERMDETGFAGGNHIFMLLMYLMIDNALAIKRCDPAILPAFFVKVDCLESWICCSAGGMDYWTPSEKALAATDWETYLREHYVQQGRAVPSILWIALDDFVKENLYDIPDSWDRRVPKVFRLLKCAWMYYKNKDLASYREG